MFLLPVNRPASNLPKSKGGKSSQASTSTARLHLPAQHTGGSIPKTGVLGFISREAGVAIVGVRTCVSWTFALDKRWSHEGSGQGQDRAARKRRGKGKSPINSGSCFWHPPPPFVEVDSFFVLTSGKCRHEFSIFQSIFGEENSTKSISFLGWRLSSFVRAFA